MMELEKVTKGLEAHEKQDKCVSNDGEACPYYSYYDCSRRLADDALELLKELLKEQEPRVMQISEIMEIYKADPFHVWPYNTPPYLYIQEHPHVRNSSESWAAWREIKDIIEGELFGHTAQSYGKTWRCWTAKPTDEQREAVKWDDKG